MAAASAQESKLTGLSLREAYAAIREWYSENLPLIEWRSGSYYTSSAALIRALPDPGLVSDAEIAAVLVEVVSGLLEWGYSESDGQFRMSEYAYAALKTAGRPTSLTPDDREELRTSRIWGFLTFNRKP